MFLVGVVLMMWDPCFIFDHDDWCWCHVMIDVCMSLLSLLLFYDDVSSSSLSSVEIFLLSVDPSFNCRQWEF